MISTPAPEHNDSFGDARKQSRVSSIERVGFTETSFRKEQRSPIQVRGSQKLNPEQSENTTPEKFRRLTTCGNTSQASPYAKLGYFEGIN